jgi:DNA-binding transcriptional LysR family regulator
VTPALTGSFTQAAADLRLSQPVVSRTIGDIERQVGARPLERPVITRKLALHLRSGEALQPAARQFADHLQGEVRDRLLVAAGDRVAEPVRRRDHGAGGLEQPR